MTTWTEAEVLRHPREAAEDIARLERENTQLAEYADALRTQLAITTGVLAGNDLTRPELVIAESRALIAKGRGAP